MTNWTNPHTLLIQADAFQKLYLMLAGICLYDIASTILFDWRLVTKTDPQQRLLSKAVKWVYIACRFFNLVDCILFTIIDVAHGNLPCQVLWKVVDFCALSTTFCATLLLSVRAAVVWKWNKAIVSALSVAFIAAWALNIRSTVMFQTTNNEVFEGPRCDMSAVHDDTPSFVLLLALDLSVLILLFWGLWRWDRLRSTGLCKILRDQGLIYLVMTVCIEIPLVTLWFLDYNQYMGQYFSVIGCIMLPTTATRLYRSLTTAGNRVMYTYEFTHPQTLWLPAVPSGFCMSVHDTEGTLEGESDDWGSIDKDAFVTVV